MIRKMKLLDRLLKPNSISKTKKPEMTTSSSEDNFQIVNESKLLNLINESFICNCCFEILKHPVTLPCGHSFCQFCLANWYLASESTKCATCRQEWTKIPQTNFILKSTIKTVIAHELIQSNFGQNDNNLNEYLKNCEKLNEKEIKTIQEFEKKFQQKLNISAFFNSNSGINPVINRPFFNDVRVYTRRVLNYGFYIILGFIFGILAGFILVSIIWCFSSLFFFNQTSRETIYESFMKIRKKYALKTEEWNSDDVQEWLTQLGPWTGDFMLSAKNTNLGKMKDELAFD